MAVSALWSERHQPRSEADLVITKKRIEQVREFLVAGTRRLLILRGPPGCGKASVLQGVCGDLGLEVVEWSNGTRFQSRSGTSFIGESLSDAFLRFLALSDRYGGLQTAVTPLQTVCVGGARRSRVALVRDFPFTLLDGRGEGARRVDGFLERIKAAVRAGSIRRAVLCFNDSREDHKVITRLLAQMDAEAATTIFFDSVARTFVQRAIDGVARAEGIDPAAANTAIIAAECNGDLRHALNALQLKAGGARTLLAPRKTARGRGRAGKTAPAPPQGGKEALEAGIASVASTEAGTPGLRLASLGLFHALGRLLYCKRIPPQGYLVPGSSDCPATLTQMGPPAKKRRRGAATDGSDVPEPRQLPHEMLVPKCSRPPLYFEPEQVIETSNTEPRSVVEWLFTNAPRFYGDVGDLAEFTECLAEIDAWDESHRVFSAGEAVLPPWDVFASYAQARALLDANLHPVPPTFGDLSGGPASQDSSSSSSFNMVRPLLRDIEVHRQRRIEELAVCVEGVGPQALGCAGAGQRLLVRVLPFVHLLLSLTRGTHAKLQRLPHSLMRLVMELSAFDGSVLRRADGGRTDAGFGASGVSRDENSITSSWATALEDDPIEGF
eukprot:TRINITY_DN68677_c0_g1_i1.p1 TRINITY_DN68677_c0_g1~~TRINITY_DN68677_c0_g1_i1.p1  ORF type:complete len:610 (-),score=86.49 TRINITY_DN68677_c0_g1_i1:75-1904(-)